jgi:hypothetical protein
MDSNLPDIAKNKKEEQTSLDLPESELDALIQQ